MPTVAAQINALARRRDAALSRGGITLTEQIYVLEVSNKFFETVREHRANFDDILWRWKYGKLDSQ